MRPMTRSERLKALDRVAEVLRGFGGYDVPNACSLSDTPTLQVWGFVRPVPRLNKRRRAFHELTFVGMTVHPNGDRTMHVCPVDYDNDDTDASIVISQDGDVDGVARLARLLLESGLEPLRDRTKSKRKD